MVRFKIGDNVVGIGIYDGACIDKKIGTVIDIFGNSCTVKFQENIYDGNGYKTGWGEDHRCWGMPTEKIFHYKQCAKFV